MKRSQLEHIIRAAGSIADDNELIVLGSASIFAQFPNIPEEFLLSIKADVFPKNKPHMSDIIDGCIGELSPFHESFGYYAHGISPETANNLPDGWDKRLIQIRNENTGGMTGLCLEIHDLIAGKYVSSREKDLQFARLIINHQMVNKTTMLERVEDLRVDAVLKGQIRQKIINDFERSTTEKI
ncbi:MAG: hypothetical protein E3J56_06355 [Candidatus Aminicenantes bacterium]|nr:MAG: hypothetical protein E3J56_06355 [Candidatus Aminicenantes bacterium]